MSISIITNTSEFRKWSEARDPNKVNGPRTTTGETAVISNPLLDQEVKTP